MQTVSVHKQNSPAPIPQEATKPAALRKLLVAYDFSSASETALRYAIEIARTFHSEIVLAHIETPETLRDRMDDGVVKAKLELLGERYDLNLLADRLKSEGIKVSYLIESGSVTDLLVQLVAELKPDLLLIGRTAIMRRTGSRSVLRPSTCCDLWAVLYSPWGHPLPTPQHAE